MNYSCLGFKLCGHTERQALKAQPCQLQNNSFNDEPETRPDQTNWKGPNADSYLTVSVGVQALLLRVSSLLKKEFERGFVFLPYALGLGLVLRVQIMVLLHILL